MHFIPFDRNAIIRQLHQLERHLSFDGNSEPMYDSHGRPVDEGRQAPGHSILEVWGRVKRVQRAIEDAQPLTLEMLQQDFAGLNIAMIWPMLKSLLQDIVMYVGGGALVGGALGSLAGGVGAVPGAIVGGEIGAFVLQMIGIAELVEAMMKFFPAVSKLYASGLQHAWGQLPARSASNSGAPINPVYQPGYAAREIAQGNKMMVYALLAGMVAYMLRSGGSAQKLMAEVAKNSKLGPAMAKWLAENEQKLLNHPRLREHMNTGPTKQAGGGAGASGKSGAAGGASGKSGGAASEKPAGAKGGEQKGSSSEGGKHAADEKPQKKPEGEAKKPSACAATPLPVDAIFGCKFLTGTQETDFDLPAPLGLAWQRSYSSDNPVVGWLGQGWSVPLSLALQMSAHAVTVLDGLHRGITFPMLPVGEAFYSRYEQMTLSRTGELNFELLDKDGVLNRFTLAGPTARTAQLVQKSDRNGNTIAIQYDAQQLPSAVIDSAGRELQLQFSQYKRLLSILERRQHEDGTEQLVTLLSYEYDAAGDLICVRNRAGEITREFAYQQHILVKHGQPGGLVSEYEYNEYTPQGRVLRNTTNTGQSWRLAYGKHQTQVSDNLGRNIRHRFDEKKRFLGTVDALGGFTKRELDSYGNLIALTDPTGRTERYVYDERSRLLKIEAADGAVTRLSYQGTNDKPVSIIDALGHKTSMRYDAAGNLLSVTDALDQSSSYEYDERGLPIKIIDARGGSKLLSYNRAGQLTSYTDCSGQSTGFAYDPDGNLTQTTTPSGDTTRYAYDGAGRLLTTDYPDGGSESYAYDDLGRMVGHIDGAGQRTAYTYDAQGRLLSRTNALGGKLGYMYDEAKRLAQLVNENGAVYAFSYDVLDRLVQETGFDTRTTRYQHDAAGRVTGKIEFGIGDVPTLRRAANDAPEAPRPHQIDTQYQRDGAGRLAEKIIRQANQSGQADQEQALRTRYQYDALGRLTFAANDSANVSLEYDAIGQLLAEKSSACGKTSALRHSYDVLGNRVQTLLPDGRTLNQLFYGSGHLHQINLDGEVVSDIERDANHREISRSQGALRSSFAYDPLGRLKQQLAQLDPQRTLAHANLAQQRSSLQALDAAPTQLKNDANAGQNIIARQYDYDQNGNLLSINDQRQGRSLFDYDAIGRILSASQPKLQEQFAFDPAHNLLDASELPKEQAGRLVNNQLTVFEDKRYQYDAHGNLIDKKTGRHTHLQLQWNAEHQLIRSEVSRDAQQAQPTIQSTEYAYDPFGRRILKRDAFGETRFTWDGNRLLSEARGAHSRTYLYAGNGFVPLAQVDKVHADEDAAAQSNLLYFHTDHLGTPRELTDGAGDVQWAATYKAWGNVVQVVLPSLVITPANNAFEQLQALRFQGQYFDVETGLHYNRFRYYDPDIGRFISQDPIGLNGGNNLYQYAPNPNSWIDPLGLAGYTVGANTAGTDMLSRGVHVNVSGPGLPSTGGHIGLVPNADGSGISLVPADKATRDLTTSQWNKAQASVEEYLGKTKNIDRMEKSAQAGIDKYPNTPRAEEMKKVKEILNSHKTKGTCPCA